MSVRDQAAEERDQRAEGRDIAAQARDDLVADATGRPSIHARWLPWIEATPSG